MYDTQSRFSECLDSLFKAFDRFSLVFIHPFFIYACWKHRGTASARSQMYSQCEPDKTIQQLMGNKTAELISRLSSALLILDSERNNCVFEHFSKGGKFAKSAVKCSYGNIKRKLLIPWRLCSAWLNALCSVSVLKLFEWERLLSSV